MTRSPRIHSRQYPVEQFYLRTPVKALRQARPTAIFSFTADAFGVLPRSQSADENAAMQNSLPRLQLHPPRSPVPSAASEPTHPHFLSSFLWRLSGAAGPCHAWFARCSARHRAHPEVRVGNLSLVGLAAPTARGSRIACARRARAVELRSGIDDLESAARRALQPRCLMSCPGARPMSCLTRAPGHKGCLRHHV